MPAISLKPKLLFYIGSLRAGGKERRLVELIKYLKREGHFELFLALTEDNIQFDEIFTLDIPYFILKKSGAKTSYSIFYKFFKLCNTVNPDLIHTWGSKQSFYALPTALLKNIPLINSQITSAPPNIDKWSVKYFIDRINFCFSTVILSNSQAGIDVYHPPIEKSIIIRNGIDMNRFVNLPSIAAMKKKYNVRTRYAVIMAASMSPNKDYALFYEVAKIVTDIRKDITFIGCGGCYFDDPEYKKIIETAEKIPNVYFHGNIADVEALMNACNIGVLFSNNNVHGEGLSNSILEYMALGKPVIANDSGGTRELISHNKNGYLIKGENAGQIANLIIELIEDPAKAMAMGQLGRKLIIRSFSLKAMGTAFERVYFKSLTHAFTRKASETYSKRRKAVI